MVFCFAVLSMQLVSAQEQPAPNQNPDFMVSRARYMGMADSINSWHSTTPQETYKAIDYLADKKEARDLRRAYRQERARTGGWYNYNNGYRYPAYNNYPYLRNDLWWNILPWALAPGYHWHPYRRW